MQAPFIEGGIIGVIANAPAGQQPPIFINTYTGDGMTQFPEGQWVDVDVSAYVPADAIAVRLDGLLIISHGTTTETADLTVAFRTDTTNSYSYTMQCVETAVGSGQRTDAGTWVALSAAKKFQMKWTRSTGGSYPTNSAYGINLSLTAYVRPGPDIASLQAQVTALSQSVSAAAAAAAASAQVAAERAGESAASATSSATSASSASASASSASSSAASASASAAAAAISADEAEAAATSAGGGTCTCTATLKTKVGSFTRELSAANSTESYVVGFRPAMLNLALTGGGVRPGCLGFVDSTSQRSVILSVYDAPGGLSSDGSRAIALYTNSSGTDYVFGTVTFTDTGFNIAWSKAGSPSGLYAGTYTALAL